MKAASTPTGADDVRRMFTRIAGRYDLLNRLMTLGQDRRWRRQTIAKLRLNPHDRLLDIGAGTGDLVIEALRQDRTLNVIAADFTPAMIRQGQSREVTPHVRWVVADAQALPFASKTFDAVVCGFLLRNVEDVDQALREQVRILRSGGRVASLDTTPPKNGIIRPLIQLYYRWVIPFLGRCIARDEYAYRYLPESSQSFLPAPLLAHKFISNGFSGVQYVRRMLGTIAIHWAGIDDPAGQAPSGNQPHDVEDRLDAR